MRHLNKLEEPKVLVDNKAAWLAEYKAEKTNPTKKFRYRHPDIKTCLKKETGHKCIYCESKIGHNTPGDIEHLTPSTKDEDKHFDWNNLSIACTECNRRKNDYYETGNEFLNPYTDNDIEQLVQHLGPIVNWKNGHKRAEISVKILELNNNSRTELIVKKIEKIEEVSTLIERYLSETNLTLKKIQELQLIDMANNKAEFSGMVKCMLEQKGMPN